MIEIPPKALVMPVGPAACGKSTLGWKFFPPRSIVSSDECRAMVSDDPTNQECNQRAFDLFHRWMEHRLALGKLVYADATNLTPSARKPLREMAAQYGVPVIVVRFDVPEEECRKRNLARERRVPDHVITKHVAQARTAIGDLEREGYEQIITVGMDDNTIVSLSSYPPVLRATGFDIIGDVHSCADELLYLLNSLGYTTTLDSDDRVIWAHPQGRKLVFVGDITDRGPYPLSTLHIWRSAVRSGHGAVMGNHDDKLRRALRGNKVFLSHGLAETYAALQTVSQEDRQAYLALLDTTPYQLRLVVDGHPDVYVCHAGMPRDMIGRDDKAARAHCIYGEVLGHGPDGYPVRGNAWEATWTAGGDDPILIHGHVVNEKVYPQDFVNVLNVDTGCAFGGHLTAYRYPEHEIVQVPALKTYAEHH